MPDAARAGFSGLGRPRAGFFDLVRDFRVFGVGRGSGNIFWFETAPSRIFGFGTGFSDFRCRTGLGHDFRVWDGPEQDFRIWDMIF